MKKKNRCPARAFATGRRCEKRRYHPGEMVANRHVAGDDVWVDGVSTLKEIGIPTWDVGKIRIPELPLLQIHPVAKLPLFQIEPNYANRSGDQIVDEAFDEAFDDSRCECGHCTTSPQVTASPEQQLTEWWIQQAEDEVARTVPKAVEYSATDLVDIGRDLARAMGREISDEEAAELGVFFYLRGKMSRWVGSVIAGQRISDDTLFDIGVYVRMAQRIRDVGSWPGVDFTEAPKLQLTPEGDYAPDPRYPNRSAG